VLLDDSVVQQLQARFHYRHTTIFQPDALLVELAKECNLFQRGSSALFAKQPQNAWIDKSAKHTIKFPLAKDKR
jgi:hypothetical protein